MLQKGVQLSKLDELFPYFLASLYKKWTHLINIKMWFITQLPIIYITKKTFY